MSRTDNALSEALAARRANVERAELPSARYDRDGDCLEILISAGDYFARRVNGTVTVYVSRETGEPVGLVFKGVVAFIKEQAPGYEPGEPIDVRNILHYYRWATEWHLQEALRDFRAVQSEAERLAPDEREFTVA